MVNFFSWLFPKKKNEEKERSPLEAAEALDELAISNEEINSERFQRTADIEREDETWIYAESLTLDQLVEATGNFNSGNFLGQGKFGKVYKGTISGQIVAVKQLDWKELEDNPQEFQWEVLFLSGLHHPNLVGLLGFCCDGKLLVFEFMSKGSLDRHLFDIHGDQEPLSWYRRMKIALDVALGLDYLHLHAMKDLTIYRDLKCTNILLDEQYNAKISNFSHKFGVPADLVPKLTTKSDIYSHGVLMLELITGQESVDDTNSPNNLVMRARPMLGHEQRYKNLVDTRLVGKYPEKDLNRAVSMAIMCVQEDPESRPTMKDVIQALQSLSNRSGNQFVEDIRQAARARAKDQATSSSRNSAAKDERRTS